MEKTLAALSDTYTNGLYIATGIFFVLFLVRFVLVIRNRNQRHFIFSSHGDWFIYILKFVFLIAMLAFLVDVPVWFITVSQFRAIVSPLLYGFFLATLISISVQEIILCFTVSDSLIQQFVKRILFFLVSIFCFLAFGSATFIAPKTYVYPSVEECVLLDLPVKGTWLAGHAGQEAWVNYHSAYPPQKFAMDITKLNAVGKYFMNNGSECTDFNSFGDSVFAPIGGIVFNFADTFETQKVLNGSDTINPAGNFVEIEIDKSKYLFLAHLLKGSVQVKTGDTLQKGQWLGLSGNSGNTTWPHLHMHIQNQPALNDTNAVGLPYRFHKMNRKRWFVFKEVNNEYLIRNDHFKSE